MLQHAPYSSSCKQIGVIGKAQDQTGRTFVYERIKIEQRFESHPRNRRQFQVLYLQRTRTRRIQHGQGNLKQRITICLAFRMHLFDQSFKRQMLMGKGSHRRVFNPLYKFGKGRLTGKIEPHYQRIQKKNQSDHEAHCDRDW